MPRHHKLAKRRAFIDNEAGYDENESSLHTGQMKGLEPRLEDITAITVPDRRNRYESKHQITERTGRNEFENITNRILARESNRNRLSSMFHRLGRGKQSNLAVQNLQRRINQQKRKQILKSVERKQKPNPLAELLKFKHAHPEEYKKQQERIGSADSILKEKKDPTTGRLIKWRLLYGEGEKYRKQLKKFLKEDLAEIVKQGRLTQQEANKVFTQSKNLSATEINSIRNALAHKSLTQKALDGKLSASHPELNPSRSQNTALRRGGMNCDLAAKLGIGEGPEHLTFCAWCTKQNKKATKTYNVNCHILPLTVKGVVKYRLSSLCGSCSHHKSTFISSTAVEKLKGGKIEGSGVEVLH